VLRRANARKREESAKKKNVNTRPVASAERVRERESACRKNEFCRQNAKKTAERIFYKWLSAKPGEAARALLAQNFIENFLCQSRANGHDGDKSGPDAVIYCGLPLFRLKRAEMQIFRRLSRSLRAESALRQE
jgi:hypothetical protein